MFQHSSNCRLSLVAILATFSVVGCQPDPEELVTLYDSAPVDRQDIRVTVEASGVIEPETTVEVKSKASGEILTVHADTGDVVESGALLVEVDKRTPRNELAEAEASLIAARARRQIAQTQMERSEKLFESGTLTQTDIEQTQLEFANAQAQVVSAEVAVENARISMSDTDVRASITGTIIERHIEPGTVISSPTQAVSDGTILMKMADLSVVQVRTLVDETDIGKIRPGMEAAVTVAAYPNQPFQGKVLKIEPQAIVDQNVTMFAVLISIDNEAGLLMPGMNAEVSIKIAERENVTAVPTAALRALDDIPAVAVMLGMTKTEIRAALGLEAQPEGPETISIGGRRIPLPEGIDRERVEALLENQNSGRELSNKDRALVRRIMGEAFGDRSGGGRPSWSSGGEGSGEGSAYQFGGEYWVVAMRANDPVPVLVATGLTDLGYSEVVSGLEPGDRVMLLPSTSLFEQQERLQQFITERFSSGPFQQNQSGGGRGRF